MGTLKRTYKFFYWFIKTLNSFDCALHLLIEYTVSYLQVNLNHITTIQWASLDVLDKRPVNKNFIVHVSVLSIFRLREWRGFHITKQITSELSHVMPQICTHIWHTTPTPLPPPNTWNGVGEGWGCYVYECMILLHPGTCFLLLFIYHGTSQFLMMSM